MPLERVKDDLERYRAELEHQGGPPAGAPIATLWTTASGIEARIAYTGRETDTQLHGWIVKVGRETWFRVQAYGGSEPWEADALLPLVAASLRDLIRRAPALREPAPLIADQFEAFEKLKEPTP